MQQLAGKHKGSNTYEYDEYLYHIDNRYDDTFRCSLRRANNCRGCVILQNDNSVCMINEHNHPKTPFIKARTEMKEEMLRLSRETHIPLKEIFDSVSRR